MPPQEPKPDDSGKIGSGSRKRILTFLLANKGKILDWREIRKAAGDVEQWSRRMRELLDEYGYQILSHRDRKGLRPGQYLLETEERLYVVPRTISAQLRAFILDRNGFTCWSCGAAAGDPDPYNTGRKVHLEIGHILDKSKGGADRPENLRAVCNVCNKGLQDTALPNPKRIDVLKQVRRASIDDQLFLLEWLLKRHEKVLEKKTK